MGTIRKDADPFDVKTQYPDTEFPQRRNWLTLRFQSIFDEVSMAEYVHLYLRRWPSLFRRN